MTRASQKHALEARAMTGDRSAVLEVVSDLRKYRSAARKLLDLRYLDGAVDGAAMASFESEVCEIEGDE